VAIPRLTGPITLDGRVDEPAWQAVPVLPLTTYLPVAGRHPTDSSEVRLAYDDDFLYASARFYVSDPAEIQSTSLGRDQLGPDDRFRIMLDTYDDNRTGVGFLVTPSGARSDLDMTEDGGNVSGNWNTYWDAATTRDVHGWYAEMRIPFSSLRFHPVNGRVTMGLIALRVSVRKNEWSTWPALSSTMANALWRASVAGKITFTGLERRSPVYVTPYALGGVSREAALSSDGSRYQFDHPSKADVGGDLKYGLSDDLTLDATVNTDFAQVEADNQQVNLTRFSLFFPEKRQFFLERSGSFDFITSGAGDGSRLFYSRQIGLAADGTPLRLYGGGRLVGRAGPLDLGTMDLQVADGTGGSENIGVVRARHPVAADGSYLGGIVTSRVDGSRYNVVVGADAVIRPFGNEYLTLQAVRSADDRLGSGSRASQARIDWARRSSQGLIYFVRFKWSGRDFEPGLGFEPRRDYAFGALELDYNWISRSGYSLQPSFFGYFYRRNADGRLDSGELYPYVNFGFPSGLAGWVAWRLHDEDLTAPLDLSASASVPAGRHVFQEGELYLTSATGSRFGYVLLANVGGFYDGHRTAVDFTPTWSLSPHLTVGGEYQLTRLSFPSRHQRLNADLARLSLRAAYDTRLSLEAFLQYNHAARLGVSNVRLRYQFTEGTDLYVVYNDQLNTDRTRLMPQGPELPFSQRRTLLVKYSRTFTL
ncbi:MAG TPA: DUF5916 domain-containing protein, partial [Gemmatimonadales bacterium]|nr:DUF5916 domain-containing protein [Gemmatimonadales bacterium]